MKIGIIADIHAEYNPLKIALDQLQGHGVDHIICAGDLVEKGTQPDKVVSLIRERSIPCVMGNHDAVAPSNQLWLRENLIPDRLDDLLISEESLEFLKNLPATLRFEWEGKSILLAHGTPWHNAEYVFPFSQRTLFDRVLKEANTDIVILGHTHEPMEIKHQNRLILNPGSVCSQGSSTYGILTLPEYSFQVHRI